MESAPDVDPELPGCAHVDRNGLSGACPALECGSGIFAAASLERQLCPQAPSSPYAIAFCGSPTSQGAAPAC